MESELTTEYWALEELPQKLVLKQNVWNCPQRGAGGQFPGHTLQAENAVWGSPHWPRKCLEPTS